MRRFYFESNLLSWKTLVHGPYLLGTTQGVEILRPFENPGFLKIFHTFLMKYPDLAPQPGQNDTQLVRSSTKFDRV